MPRPHVTLDVTKAKEGAASIDLLGDDATLDRVEAAALAEDLHAAAATAQQLRNEALQSDDLPLGA